MSTGVAPAVSPRGTPSTVARVAPDAPHYVTDNTRPNPNAENTFDSPPTKGAPVAKPPAKCVEFSYT